MTISRLLVALATLFTLTVPITAASATADLPTAAPLADRDCGDFARAAKDDDIPRPWTDAYLFYRRNDPARDPHGLDGDRDGYPCESLPLAEKVTGEPGCYRTGATFKQNCQGRNQYRLAKLLTVHLDYAAIRKTFLDVFAPQAYANQNSTGSMVENVLNEMNTTAEARCVRPKILSFIKEQNRAEKVASTADNVFGIGQKVIKSAKAVPAPGRFIMKQYMTIGQDLATAMSKVAVTTSARNHLNDAFACMD